VIKKAQQRLHFLGILEKNRLEQKLLVTFYRTTIESVLMYCITAWFAGSSAANRKVLQGVINMAQTIIGCPLPHLEEIATSHCLAQVKAILSDPSHPTYHLFDLLSSGRRYKSI